MRQQLTIFDTITHHENNAESQQHYEANKIKFSRKCKQVLEILISGKRINVLDALVKHGISSLPRRILDLKNKEVEISDKWVKEHSYKEWFMTEDQIKRNKELTK